MVLKNICRSVTNKLTAEMSKKLEELLVKIKRINLIVFMSPK